VRIVAVAVALADATVLAMNLKTAVTRSP